MKNATVRTSKHVQLIRENDRYFRMEYNAYIGSYTLKEIEFDENGKCELHIGGHCYPTYDKTEIDILMNHANA